MDEKYKEMVSLKTEKDAIESVRKLKKEFDSAKTEAKKLRILKVVLMFSNRAKSRSKNNKLSIKKRNDYREIGRIYKKTSDQFGMRMSPMTPKYAKMKYKQYEKNRRW